MSMRGQLNELKQMMKLSFDLQLDIQRSIRQEVAAALSSALSQQSQHEDRATRSYGEYNVSFIVVHSTNCKAYNYTLRS